MPKNNKRIDLSSMDKSIIPQKILWTYENVGLPSLFYADPKKIMQSLENDAMAVYTGINETFRHLKTPNPYEFTEDMAAIGVVKMSRLAVLSMPEPDYLGLSHCIILFTDLHYGRPVFYSVTAHDIGTALLRFNSKEMPNIVCKIDDISKSVSLAYQNYRFGI